MIQKGVPFKVLKPSQEIPESVPDSKRLRRQEVLRKLLHVLLSLLLLIPILEPYREILSSFTSFADPTLLTYTILTMVMLLVNSIQIKALRLSASMYALMREGRKKLLDHASRGFGSMHIADFIKSLDELMRKVEEGVTEFVKSIERDYERRYGYVAASYALVSTLASYAIFGECALYGIIALATIDPLASIVTVFSKKRLLLKHALESYLVALASFSAVTFVLTSDALASVLIALVGVIVEALSPEDNLTLPFCVSAASYLLFKVL